MPAPASGDLRVLVQQYDPLFALTLMTARLVCAAVNHASTSSGAAEGVCAGVDGVGQDGVHGAASLWNNAYSKGHRATYAVHDGTESKLVDCKPYFDETAVSD